MIYVRQKGGVNMMRFTRGHLPLFGSEQIDEEVFPFTLLAKHLYFISAKEAQFWHLKKKKSQRTPALILCRRFNTICSVQDKYIGESN